MTDLAAALGSAQLARLDTMNARRAGIARRYTDAFAEDPALEPPVVRTERTTAWQLYILRLRLEALTVDRAAFIEALKQRGIGTSVHFIPLHLHPYWRDAYGLRPGSFPVASREFERVISLPIYSAMSDEDATAVIEAVREVARANRR
jgi:dTDP-4-amino-4,6-dideoxygalactose transaminase